MNLLQILSKKWRPPDCPIIGVLGAISPEEWSVLNGEGEFAVTAVDPCDGKSKRYSIDRGYPDQVRLFDGSKLLTSKSPYLERIYSAVRAERQRVTTEDVDPLPPIAYRVLPDDPEAATIIGRLTSYPLEDWRIIRPDSDTWIFEILNPSGARVEVFMRSVSGGSDISEYWCTRTDSLKVDGILVSSSPEIYPAIVVLSALPRFAKRQKEEAQAEVAKRARLAELKVQEEVAARDRL